jgi:outer membrane protein OmpA-like peptidoglycan-associated protein
MQAECPASVVFHFPTGAVTPLELNAKATFDPIIGWARQHESAIVAVEGHADTVGEDESNLLLSYQRARAVAAMLERHGVAALQVQIAATGSHGLIAGIPGDAFGNRRVTIQIKNPGVCRISSH